MHSVDPGQTLHSVAPVLDLQGLPRSHIKDARYILVHIGQLINFIKFFIHFINIKLDPFVYSICILFSRI